MDCFDCFKNHLTLDDIEPNILSLQISSDIMAKNPQNQKVCKETQRISLRRKPEQNSKTESKSCWQRESLGNSLTPLSKVDVFCGNTSPRNYGLLDHHHVDFQRKPYFKKVTTMVEKKEYVVRNREYFMPYYKFNVVPSTTQQSKQSLISNKIGSIFSNKNSSIHDQKKIIETEPVEENPEQENTSYNRLSHSAQSNTLKNSRDKKYIRLPKPEKYLTRSLVHIKTLDEIECAQSVESDNQSQFSEVIESPSLLRVQSHNSFGMNGAYANSLAFQGKGHYSQTRL